MDDEYNSVVLGIYDEYGCWLEEDINYDYIYLRVRNNWLYWLKGFCENLKII